MTKGTTRAQAAASRQKAVERVGKKPDRRASHVATPHKKTVVAPQAAYSYGPIQKVCQTASTSWYRVGKRCQDALALPSCSRKIGSQSRNGTHEQAASRARSRIAHSFQCQAIHTACASSTKKNQ